MLPYYGGTMLEPHRVLPGATSYHKQPASAFKQHWLAFYGSIMHTVTASCVNVRDNCTMLAVPGQFCHTICAIPSMYNAVLNSIIEEYSDKS